MRARCSRPGLVERCAFVLQLPRQARDPRQGPTPAATTHHAKIPATCGSCHNGVLKDFNESAHGTAMTAGRKGPVCSTCHEPHAIKNPDAAATRHEVSDGCGNCHEK